MTLTLYVFLTLFFTFLLLLLLLLLLGDIVVVAWGKKLLSLTVFNSYAVGTRLGQCCVSNVHSASYAVLHYVTVAKKKIFFGTHTLVVVVKKDNKQKRYYTYVPWTASSGMDRAQQQWARRDLDRRYCRVEMYSCTCI